MTKFEAILAMQGGEKTTHRTFTSDEWITIKDGKIVTEEGYEISGVEFWADRTHENFNTDWSIYNTKNA